MSIIPWPKCCIMLFICRFICSKGSIGIICRSFRRCWFSFRRCSWWCRSLPRPSNINNEQRHFLPVRFPKVCDTWSVFSSFYVRPRRSIEGHVRPSVGLSVTLTFAPRKTDDSDVTLSLSFSRYYIYSFTHSFKRLIHQKCSFIHSFIISEAPILPYWP